MPNTTIAAISATGAIGIVRISGPAAIFIAKSLFHPKKRLDWNQLRTHQIAYGILAEPGQAPDETQIDIIDDIICLVFPSPHSYTGEDVVEFQCHGGPAVLRRVLGAVFALGAHPAEPGEFTRRAFLNGRIDLTRAEAVMQLVTAQSEHAARAAAAAMGGALSARIDDIRGQLTALAAHIAAWVDYPEEDIPALAPAALSRTLESAITALTQLINRALSDQLMLSGIHTALVGKPNVGKSSLMNLLLGYSRSIVTDLPGTTRDTVSESVMLGTLPLRLTDTAGLRNTNDTIEAAGVERSRQAMDQAQLIFAVVDASAPLTNEDHAILQTCDPARTILIRNKCDACSERPAPHAEYNFPAVNTSALTGQGLDDLIAAAETLLGTAHISPHEAILANQRQADCAAAALSALEEARAAIPIGLDAISICIDDAIAALFALTGQSATEAVVNEVFARFCVGK